MPPVPEDQTARDYLEEASAIFRWSLAHDREHGGYCRMGWVVIYRRVIECLLTMETDELRGLPNHAYEVACKRHGLLPYYPETQSGDSPPKRKSRVGSRKTEGGVVSNLGRPPPVNPDGGA